MSDGSPFLEVPESEWLAANDHAFAIRDRFPVTPGHTLVVTRRLAPSWWDATPEERQAVLVLVDEVKARLDAEHQPDGYNVGFNAGLAAGQTVNHLHVHVIPRYEGDIDDPRGGVRHVIPSKGNYLAPYRSHALLDGQHHRLHAELVRRLQQRVDRIDMLVSFVMRSGLALIDGLLVDAIDRGAQVRILTSDYLEVTDPVALARLLDLTELWPPAPECVPKPPAEQGGSIEVRVFQDETTSFHPKSYLFYSTQTGYSAGFVGSSNLSASGLDGGIEWNLRIDSTEELVQAFEHLWQDPRSHVLTQALLQEYRIRWRHRPIPTPEEPREPPATAPAPRPIQRDALDALERTRAGGFKAALAVMATGLGKTWLAAFDTARPQFRRVLFIAHRDEILNQSFEIFRRVRPDANLGLYNGRVKQSDADVVFASIQTLARRLSAFSRDEFDYVVVDEFHHAAARSYRKVLDHFDPGFLLGLTATPQRLDGADLLALCGDNLAYECGLYEGISRGELSLFTYFGIPDDIDYTPIPWRGGRFDEDALSRAAETQQRAQHAYQEWRAKGGGPTLGFCVTVRHADFMAEYFRSQGIIAVAAHSGPSSAPRRQSLQEMRDGTLQVIFTVDLFNEGLDVPEIETILMLRPTYSPVVFLQQLGRGLRKTQTGTPLTVVDFIGNHRSFLVKPRTLLGLGSDTRPPSTRETMQALKRNAFSLPPGCSITYDPEVIELLTRLTRTTAPSVLEDYCRLFHEEYGQRPTAVQAHQAQLNPASVRNTHGGWFGFLQSLEMLSQEEADVFDRYGEVLSQLEIEQIYKSYKLVALLALLRIDALRTGTSVNEAAVAARHLISQDPRLVEDIGPKELPESLKAPGPVWRDYWRRWPLAAWAGQLRGGSGLFSLDEHSFTPRFHVDDRHGETFDGMAEELLRWRLARYLDLHDTRLRAVARLRVIQTNGRPMIMLDRGRAPDIPEGEVRFVSDGVYYVGNFVKIALNVARREGEEENKLPDLLRSWFGPSAGHPGTEHYVELDKSPTGWELRPVKQGTGRGGRQTATG